jgi:hypothetical protein
MILIKNILGVITLGVWILLIFNIATNKNTERISQGIQNGRLEAILLKILYLLSLL